MFKWLYRKYLLKKLKLNRVERLVYIGMDIDYFQRVIEVYGEEDTLRKELKDEKEKDIKDQDLELIGKLNDKINAVKNATQNITDYKNVQKELGHYLKYLEMKGDEKIKETLLKL
jgi:hypothetical protein